MKTQIRLLVAAAPLVAIAVGLGVRYVANRAMGHSAKVAAQRSVGTTLVSQS
jgi:hypothetical protein